MPHATANRGQHKAGTSSAGWHTAAAAEGLRGRLGVKHSDCLTLPAIQGYLLCSHSLQLLHWGSPTAESPFESG